MLFFEDFANAENRAGRALAGREIRDQPVQRRACEIILIVVPVNQRERLERRRRIRSARRDLQILEDRAPGAIGFRLERSRRHPNQLGANRRLGAHRESGVRLLFRLGQGALAQQQLGFRAMVRERVRVGDLGMRREDLSNENARFGVRVGMRILVAQFHQLRVSRLWISERDKRLRFRDTRALLYRRVRIARDQPRRDLGRLRVASQVQQVVRQHQLAGIDHHAIRIGLDKAIERLRRRIQIALVVLREREVKERIVAERREVVGSKFEIDDGPRIVMVLVRAIAVKERSLPVGRWRERRDYRSGGRRRSGCD